MTTLTIRHTFTRPLTLIGLINALQVFFPGIQSDALLAGVTV
jgi:hypothetical protein